MFDDLGSFLFVGCLAYGLGSIPFGLILTRMAGAGDIRQIGSGNIGATNVLRTGNKKLAVATLIFDAGKGAAAVFLTATLVSPDLMAIAGLIVVIGHCFPIWLKFNGGKGVAALAALDFRLGAVFVIVWLVTAFLSRYSSLSALLAIAACVVTGFITLDDITTKIAILLLGGLVWSRHHANIGRLLTGCETKI
ncbi:MAG: glycerol-3-phosphate 1-O-acyltransferase PlsY, partial [Candidatus Puniceispirillaceae bacterium]